MDRKEAAEKVNDDREFFEKQWWGFCYWVERQWWSNAPIPSPDFCSLFDRIHTDQPWAPSFPAGYLTSGPAAPTFPPPAYVPAPPAPRGADAGGGLPGGGQPPATTNSRQMNDAYDTDYDRFKSIMGIVREMMSRYELLNPPVEFELLLRLDAFEAGKKIVDCVRVAPASTTRSDRVGAGK